MNAKPDSGANVRQAVPFFHVTSMPESIRFYVDGLGCAIKNQWVVDGKLRWCWLELGEAALMLQDYTTESGEVIKPQGAPGIGVSVSFQCRDAIALYHEFKRRGLQPSKPFVGNGMWVTILQDPDGFNLEFESITDAPEESEYQEEPATGKS